MNETIESFEAGILPDSINYLYRVAEARGQQQIKNMVMDVEPVQSPSTGTLSAFIFADDDDCAEDWLADHPQYSKCKIECNDADVFLLEIEDLKTDRHIEIESLTLWYRSSAADDWHEITKPLSDFVSSSDMTDDQLDYPSSLLFLADESDNVIVTDAWLHALPSLPVMIGGKSVSINPNDWQLWLLSDASGEHLPSPEQVEPLCFYSSEICLDDQSEFDTMIHNAAIDHGEIAGVIVWMPDGNSGWKSNRFTIEQILTEYENF